MFLGEGDHVKWGCCIYFEDFQDKKDTNPVSGKPLKKRRIYDILYYEYLQLNTDTDIVHSHDEKGVIK